MADRERCHCGRTERHTKTAACYAPKVAITDMVSVPREPTVEMQRAGFEAMKDRPDQAPHPYTIYQAMLAASPQPSDERICTCHPDDNPPKPCPQKYALTECRDSAVRAEAMALVVQMQCALYEIMLADIQLKSQPSDICVAADHIAEAQRILQAAKAAYDASRSLAQPQPECTGYQVGEEHE